MEDKPNSVKEHEKGLSHTHGKKSKHHSPWHEGLESQDLCEQLQRLFLLKGCRSNGKDHVRLLQQHGNTESAIPIGEWPLKNCRLPKPASPPPVFASFLEGADAPRSMSKKSCLTVALAASASGVEFLWKSLTPGGVLVVPMHSNSSRLRPEALIRQTIYQLNSGMYYTEHHDLKAPLLGFADLQFATYFRSYGLLQKADWGSDIKSSKGRFYSLANMLDSEAISVEHNYSLLYHRTLDRVGRDDENGMAVEIGGGCSDEMGHRHGFEFWPRYFQKLNVHLMRSEPDRSCLAHWMPRISNSGITRVHIGEADAGNLEFSLGGKPNPLYSLIGDINHAGPAGLQVVVDKDQEPSTESEASFRSLFPKLAPDGLYFLEDLMRAGWGTPENMRLESRYDQTAFNPLALSAAMSVAAAGTDPSATFNKQQADAAVLFLRGKDKESSPDAAPSSTNLLETSAHLAHGLLQGFKELIVGSGAEEQSLYHSVWSWNQDLLLTAGRMVKSVECSPGICVVQRNSRPE